jgi:hypothetical protein
MHLFGGYLILFYLTARKTDNLTAICEPTV